MRIDPRRFFEFLLFLMLAMCLFFIYLRNIQDQRAGQLYHEAERLVCAADAASPFPAPSAAPSPAEDAPGTGTREDAPSGMDLSPLQEVNADVVGWIEIPGVLSYPLLKAATTPATSPMRGTARRTRRGRSFWTTGRTLALGISTPSSTDTGCGTGPCSAA